MPWQTEIVPSGDFFNTSPEHNPFYTGGNSMPSTTADENTFWQSISAGASDFIGGVGNIATAGLNAFGSVAKAAEANNQQQGMSQQTQQLLLIGGVGLVALILLR